MSYDPADDHRNFPYYRYDYPANAEWVPADVMWSLREYDRRPHAREHVDAIKASLLRWGFTSPVYLTYYQKDRTALLAEGNHRVAAAYELGIDVLVVVHRNTAYYGPRDRTSREPVPVPGYMKPGHVPAEMAPSDIGLPSRPLAPEEIALDGTRVPGTPKDR